MVHCPMTSRIVTIQSLIWILQKYIINNWQLWQQLQTENLFKFYNLCTYNLSIYIKFTIKASSHWIHFWCEGHSISQLRLIITKFGCRRTPKQQHCNSISSILSEGISDISGWIWPDCIEKTTINKTQEQLSAKLMLYHMWFDDKLIVINKTICTASQYCFTILKIKRWFNVLDRNIYQITQESIKQQLKQLVKQKQDGKTCLPWAKEVQAKAAMILPKRLL